MNNNMVDMLYMLVFLNHHKCATLQQSFVCVSFQKQVFFCSIHEEIEQRGEERGSEYAEEVKTQSSLSRNLRRTD